jgi:hypothetical protein
MRRAIKNNSADEIQINDRNENEIILFSILKILSMKNMSRSVVEFFN